LVCHYDPTGRLTSFNDSFGNTVTLTWGATAVTVSQALGNGESRDVLITFPAGPPPRLPDTLPLSMTYNDKTWTYEPDSGTAWLLHRAISPVGLAWEYSYLTGNLVQLTTPRGGQISYTYEVKQYAGPDPGTQYFTNVLTSRVTGGRVPTGQWTYTYVFGGSPVAVTTVTRTPSGARITEEHGGVGDVQSIDGQYGLLSRVVEQEQGAGTFVALETETRAYRSVLVIQHSPTRLWDTPELDHRTVTRHSAAGDRTYTTTYEYSTTNFGDYHRPHTITESGEISRTTTLAYDYNFNLAMNGQPYFNGKLGIETISVNGVQFT
jgi:YD repeat-containing protein